MKLKRLTIDNIASIQHAEIDFDAAPLRDEHLFLITGPTGAGKSTIIDCLCLALYGSTPRLDAASNREGGYEDINKDNTIKPNDAKQLLRRGSVSADIRLTFDDNDGTPYIATWHVHRARHKLENRITDVERTLQTDEESAVTTPVYLRNKKEINEHISRLIGLDMKEFFRTVVLAQGKFSEFLNSNENEKAALLEKMTGTEVFALMGKKIHEVFSEKETHRNQLLALLNEITLLNEEQKAEINNEIEKLTQQLTIWQGQCDGAKKMTDWLDEKDNNEKNLALKQQELARYEQQQQDSAIIEQQRLVNDWESTVEARRDLRDLRQAQQQLKHLHEQQPAMQEEFDQLCAALRAMVNEVEAKLQRVDEIGTFLKQEAGNSAMYDAIKTIKSQIKQYHGEKQNIHTFTQALNDERRLLPQVEEMVKSSLEEQQRQEAVIKQLQAQYDGLQVASVNATKDAVTKAQNALSLLDAKLETITREEANISKQRENLVKEQQELEKAQALVGAQRVIKEQAHEALEREKDWNALIEQAHNSLHKGDICPVCGTVIDQLQPAKGTDVIDRLKQRLKDAEDKLQGTQTLIAASTRSIDRFNQEIAERDKELERKKADCDQHWSITRQLLTRCGITVDENADKSMTTAYHAQLDKNLQDLNDTLKEADALHRHITTEQQKLVELTDGHNKAKIRLNKANDSIRYQGEAIVRSKTKLDEITHELNGLFAMPDWQEHVERDDDFIEQLEQQAAAYQLKVKTAQQLESEIKLAQAIIPAMLENQRNITGLTDNGLIADRVPDKLDEMWHKFENKNLNWNNQLAHERNDANRAQQALDAFTAGNPTMNTERLSQIDSHQPSEITAIKQSLLHLSELITHTRGEISSLKLQQGDIENKRPQFTTQNRDELAQILLDSKAQTEQLANQIAEQRAQLKQDEENRIRAGKKQQEYETANAEYQQWVDLNKMLGDSNGSKFRKIAQSYILGELLATANGYLQQFNNRYTLEAKAGTLTILVRDQIQGDVTNVSTLSGGEGFMVSLALALALSSTTGKMFSVDTLFIDEGFGSLSENYLDKVMETLNRLYDMGGRRVGIISHVDWLKERVTTQVQVTRDEKNNTVSRITVV